MRLRARRPSHPRSPATTATGTKASAGTFSIAQGRLTERRDPTTEPSRTRPARVSDPLPPPEHPDGVQGIDAANSDAKFKQFLEDPTMPKAKKIVA